MTKPAEITYLEEKYGIEFYPSRGGYILPRGHYSYQIDAGLWIVFMYDISQFNIVGFFVSNIVKHNLSLKEVEREIKKIKLLGNFK